jgi:integrase
MAYPEKRDGKLTGWFYGEVLLKKPERRFRHRFDTMKAAQGYEVYVRLMGEEPPTMGGVSSGRTFASVAQECKAKGGPKGVWHRGKDHSIIQRVDHIVGIVGSIDIAAFTRGNYQLIVDDLRKRPPAASRRTDARMGNATINRYLNACSAVLTFAVKAEYRDSKPETPLLPVEENLRDIIHSYDDEDAILRAMEAHGDLVEALCVRVLLESGLRKGELLEQLRASQITVETDGEQNEIGMIRLEGKQTKGKEFRSVSIPAQLARDIRAVIATETLPNACRLLSTFKRARDLCGLPKNLVIHSLRHTRNTRLRKAGVDIDVRMQLLGHKDTATSRRYDHVDRGDLLEAAKKVEQARGDRHQNSEVVPFRPKLTG